MFVWGFGKQKPISHHFQPIYFLIIFPMKAPSFGRTRPGRGQRPVVDSEPGKFLKQATKHISHLRGGWTRTHRAWWLNMCVCVFARFLFRMFFLKKWCLQSLKNLKMGWWHMMIYDDPKCDECFLWNRLKPVTCKWWNDLQMDHIPRIQRLDGAFGSSYTFFVWFMVIHPTMEIKSL